MQDRTGRPLHEVIQDLYRPPAKPATLRQKFRVYLWAFKKILKVDFRELHTAYMAEALDEALPLHCVELPKALSKIFTDVQEKTNEF
jgi:hypothetical protein